MKKIIILLSILITIPLISISFAHQDGCHAQHSCPSDNGSYTCGDKGNYSQCFDNQYYEDGKPKTSTSAIDETSNTSDQCTPNLVCFLSDDYFTIRVYGKGGSSFEETYRFGAIGDNQKVDLLVTDTILNGDVSFAVDGKTTKTITSSQEMDKRSGIYVRVYDATFIQPSPVNIDKWLKHPTSSESWKDKVKEGVYNYNGFLRSVIIIDKSHEIIDKETGLLLFFSFGAHDSSNFTMGELIDTNMIGESNVDNVQTFPVLTSDKSIFTVKPSELNPSQIPSWVKTNTKWWIEGEINDIEYVNGLRYLLKSGAMKIPTMDDYTPTNQDISYIKNDLFSWIKGETTEHIFVNYVRFLINHVPKEVPPFIDIIIPEGYNLETTVVESGKTYEFWHNPITGDWIKKEIRSLNDQKDSQENYISPKATPILENSKVADEIHTELEMPCTGTSLCYTGTVEKIVDGDTLDIDGKRIRLSLTNTPERKDSGFSEATEFTRSLCPVGSTVIVDQDDLQPYDRYDRLVAKVFCGEKIINSELLYNNHANILTSYCNTSEFSGESWAKEFGC